MKNYLELIEKFHNGELSNEELKKFESELQSNPEFKREFDLYKEEGLKMGFDIVESGPLVRSSYHADEQASLVLKT